jgi:hypothetical protein
MSKPDINQAGWRVRKGLALAQTVSPCGQTRSSRAAGQRADRMRERSENAA